MDDDWVAIAPAAASARPVDKQRAAAAAGSAAGSAAGPVSLVVQVSAGSLSPGPGPRSTVSGFDVQNAGVLLAASSSFFSFGTAPPAPCPADALRRQSLRQTLDAAAAAADAAYDPGPQSAEPSADGKYEKAFGRPERRPLRASSDLAAFADASAGLGGAIASTRRALRKSLSVSSLETFNARHEWPEGVGRGGGADPSGGGGGDEERTRPPADPGLSSWGNHSGRQGPLPTIPAGSPIDHDHSGSISGSFRFGGTASHLATRRASPEPDDAGEGSGGGNGDSGGGAGGASGDRGARWLHPRDRSLSTSVLPGSAAESAADADDLANPWVPLRLGRPSLELATSAARLRLVNGNSLEAGRDSDGGGARPSADGGPAYRMNVKDLLSKRREDAAAVAAAAAAAAAAAQAEHARRLAEEQQAAKEAASLRKRQWTVRLIKLKAFLDANLPRLRALQLQKRRWELATPQAQLNARAAQAQAAAAQEAAAARAAQAERAAAYVRDRAAAVVIELIELRTAAANNAADDGAAPAGEAAERSPGVPGPSRRASMERRGLIGDGIILQTELRAGERRRLLNARAELERTLQARIDALEREQRGLARRAATERAAALPPPAVLLDRATSNSPMGAPVLTINSMGTDSCGEGGGEDGGRSGHGSWRHEAPSPAPRGAGAADDATAAAAGARSSGWASPGAISESQPSTGLRPSNLSTQEPLVLGSPNSVLSMGHPDAPGGPGPSPSGPSKFSGGRFASAKGPLPSLPAAAAAAPMVENPLSPGPAAAASLPPRRSFAFPGLPLATAPGLMAPGLMAAALEGTTTSAGSQQAVSPAALAAPRIGPLPPVSARLVNFPGVDLGAGAGPGAAASRTSVDRAAAASGRGGARPHVRPSVELARLVGRPSGELPRISIGDRVPSAAPSPAAAARPSQDGRRVLVPITRAALGSARPSADLARDRAAAGAPSPGAPIGLGSTGSKSGGGPVPSSGRASFTGSREPRKSASFLGAQ